MPNAQRHRALSDFSVGHAAKLSDDFEIVKEKGQWFQTSRRDPQGSRPELME
jgi:hypothetical protein